MKFGESSPGIPIRAGFQAPVAARTASYPFSFNASAEETGAPAMISTPLSQINPISRSTISSGRRYPGMP